MHLIKEGELRPWQLPRRKFLFLAVLGATGTLIPDQKKSGPGFVVKNILPDSRSQITIPPHGLTTGSFDYSLELTRGYFARNQGAFYDEFSRGGLRFQVSLTAGPGLNLKISMAAGKPDKDHPETAFMSSVRDGKPVQGEVIESSWKNWKPVRMIVTGIDLLQNKTLHPIHTWLR